jgi:pantothenate kinase-related protein Tda10
MGGWLQRILIGDMVKKKDREFGLSLAKYIAYSLAKYIAYNMGRSRSMLTSIHSSQGSGKSQMALRFAQALDDLFDDTNKQRY